MDVLSIHRSGVNGQLINWFAASAADPELQAQIAALLQACFPAFEHESHYSCTGSSYLLGSESS